MLVIDIPIVELLQEIVLIVLVIKLWEYLSVASEIVQKGFKCLAVSVKEDFTLNFSEFVHLVEQDCKG